MRPERTVVLVVERMYPEDFPPRAFPFSSIRAGQKEFLRDAIEAVSDGKHLLAQAPTGLGKTAVGLAASLDVALREDKFVLFLTSRQSQHRIVVDTLRRIRSKPLAVSAVDIVSKQSMCAQQNRPRSARAFNEYCALMSRTRSCRYFNRQADAVVAEILKEPMHVQEMQQLCSSRGVCPHKAGLEAASSADVLVCDYNYVFSSLRDAILSRIGRKMSELVLVIDEAHNLPDRIRSQICGSISPRQLVRGAKDARRSDPQAAELLHRLSKVLDSFLAKVRSERRVQERLLMDLIDQAAAGGPWSCVILADACRRAGESEVRDGRGAALLDVASFLTSWNEMGSRVVRVASGGDEGRIGFRLLDPSVLSREVFAQVHSSIMMSGTLHPGEMYADLLGLEKKRVVLRAYPTPFPPENRLTIVTPRLTTLYRARTEEMMQSIANEVAGISEACPGNLAAFFPSYGVLSKVADKLKATPIRKHLMVERPEWDKAKRDMVILRMRELKARGGVLLFGVLGGSFSEGIDYNDNLLSCVIIGGLPISPPTAEVRALDDYYAAKFGSEKGFEYAYFYPAINKVMQAAGRCIRSENDRGVVVILDNRLLGTNYASRLPPGLSVRPTDDAAGEVRTFFYGGSHRQRVDPETRGGGGVEQVDMARAGGRGEAPRAEGLPEPAA